MQKNERRIGKNTMVHRCLSKADSDRALQTADEFQITHKRKRIGCIQRHLVEWHCYT
jgi:hypothetical protein